jgi:hypothetical protein
MSCLGFLHTLEDVACVGFGFVTEAHSKENVDGEGSISYPRVPIVPVARTY